MFNFLKKLSGKSKFLSNKEEYWYFETSGFNYFLKQIDYDAFLNSRELQELRQRKIMISPITLWEIMLTSDDFNSDFLVFSAQQFFTADLLATPSELVIRYLEKAYPENKVNYPIYTDLQIGEIWSRMATDTSIKFEYDKDNLKQKTDFIRTLSKQLPAILDDAHTRHDDALLQSVSRVLNVYYNCLNEDGFLPKNTQYDHKIIFKLVIVFVLLLMVFRQDFNSQATDEFWNKADIDTNNHTEMLIYFFEKYPLVFQRGPFLEMAVMAYNQVKLGKTNRGLILDCFHMVYAPYVDWIVTGDEGFEKLSNLESRYRQKLIHVKNLNIKIAPYIKK